MSDLCDGQPLRFPVDLGYNSMTTSARQTHRRPVRQRSILWRASRRAGFFYQRPDGLGRGLSAFFFSTFLAIFGIMIYNGLGHRVDYADSYKFISFPTGCVALCQRLFFLELFGCAGSLPEAERGQGQKTGNADLSLRFASVEMTN